MVEDLEMVIVRNKVYKTLFDIVEIDFDGDIVNYITRGATFEQAQDILAKLGEL